MLHARAWRSTERLPLKSRDDWWPECTRGPGMLFYLRSLFSPSPQLSIPPIPCFPSFMPTDLLFFLALISLPHHQPSPCFPVLPKSPECSRHEGSTPSSWWQVSGAQDRCKFHGTTASFSHVLWDWENLEPYAVGPFGWRGTEQTLSDTVCWQP